ncbi:MAG TPA: hypothetical protein VE955_11770 [Candidatus Dormibacteraeota bacterium]|jgi:hypothetical protein|nr:hypothetical protein [Candidatus Dormibacteraeota bacterium]
MFNAIRSKLGEGGSQGLGASGPRSNIHAPEKPTLIERIVQTIPLRYPLASLVWAAMIGSPFFHLFEYIDHGSTSFSLTPSGLVADFLYTLVPFYAFNVVKYLRLKILRAELEIVPIMSGGESDYHSAFGRISNTLPVIVLALVLMVPIIPDIVPNPHLSILVVYTSSSLFVNGIAVSTYVWAYAVSSWGLHELGESQLKLKSFLEDRTMGARAIGSVALSLTVAFLGGTLLVFLLFFSYFLASLSFQAVIYAFLALGIIMFFLPLNSIHKKLQAEKQNQQRALTQQYLAMKNEARTYSGDDAHVGKVVSELLRMKDLEITERKLASTPTWPFDVQLLVKLITIILSVTAALLARIIINVLKL